jgi:hypothetical protein
VQPSVGLMQSVETAGPDGVREQGPILLLKLYCLGHLLGCVALPSPFS